MSVIDYINRLLGVERKKNDIEILAGRIAEHIMILAQTKMDFEVDKEKEQRIQEEIYRTTSVEIRDTKFLFDLIRKEVADKRKRDDLGKEANDLLRALFDEEGKLKAVIERTKEMKGGAGDPAEIERLIKEELTRIRDAVFHLERAEREAA